MKGRSVYLFFLFVFLVFVFLSELIGPHKFVWEPTYDKKDKEPFGSYVFDDVFSSSFSDYSIINQTFYQLFKEDSLTSLLQKSGEGILPSKIDDVTLKPNNPQLNSPRAYLITEQNPSFSEIDIEYLKKILHQGNQVMICTENFPNILFNLLNFSTFRENSSRFVVNNVLKNLTRDSIFFGTDTLNPVCIFEVFPQIHPVSIMPGREKREDASMDNEDNEENEENEIDNDLTAFHCDSAEMLAWDNNNKPVAIRAYIGKGELFLVSTPLMFTNFGMLDGPNASYAFRLLSYMKNKPLIRIEAYGAHGDEPKTPLRYILSETPLRWATYTVMALLLLFMFFTAKRRQRIIPIIKAPQNRTVGFMQLISNLYYQKHDNIEILKMKYLYFCTDVKNLIGIELYEQVPGEADYDRMVEKTGMEKDFISLLLHNIRLSTYRGEVNDLQLKQYIDGMNELLRALKT